MNVTEIRIKLTNEPRNKLKAYCSITFDDAFVVRDLKIIEGGHGLFVAMPSRKLADKCRQCGGKNHLRAAYCNQCGAGLDAERAGLDERGRARLHADLAHPINRDCRIELHARILHALEEEVERSQREGYVPPSFDEFDDLADDYLDDDYLAEVARRTEARRNGRLVTPPPGTTAEAGA